MLASMLCCVAQATKVQLMLPSTTTVSALPCDIPVYVTALPCSIPVYVDGIQKNFQLYNINGSTYVKLRDFAKGLSSTADKFDISSYNYDEQTDSTSIRLQKNHYYTSNGTELQGNTSGEQANAKVSFVDLCLENILISMPCYNINNNNYFRLRHLAFTLNCGLDYNSKNNQISIDTSSYYTSQKNDSSALTLLDKWYLYSWTYKGTTKYSSDLTASSLSFYNDGTEILTEKDGLHPYKYNFSLDGDTIIKHDTSDSEYPSYFLDPYEIYESNGKKYLNIEEFGEISTYVKQS